MKLCRFSSGRHLNPVTPAFVILSLALAVSPFLPSSLNLPLRSRNKFGMTTAGTCTPKKLSCPKICHAELASRISSRISLSFLLFLSSLTSFLFFFFLPLLLSFFLFLSVLLTSSFLSFFPEPPLSSLILFARGMTVSDGLHLPARRQQERKRITVDVGSGSAGRKALAFKLSSPPRIRGPRPKGDFYHPI